MTGHGNTSSPLAHPSTTFEGRERLLLRPIRPFQDGHELRRLNTLVSAYFDAAEFRAESHQPTYMKDWLSHLDRLIVAMEARTLDGAGSVSHQQAVAKAEAEYVKYRAHIAAQPSEVETAYLETVKSVQRKIEGKKKR
ncbi:hypothetical protein BH11GEM2_BH11GEM2_15690 [soil metagenome]